MSEETNHQPSDREQHIDELMKALTLGEKVDLLAGASQWRTQAITRLGIPSIKMTDGPNGARGSQFSGGPTSACFPVSVALAATWNPELVAQVGEALAEETKSKGAHLLLAPTVNIHRSPLSGRNFECFSEDPYLSSRMAVAFINGLQSRGVGATVKHFVCNDSEFERQTISSEVDGRTLREIYLPPFEAAVTEAKAWAVMAAYNKVNGIYAGEHPGLLRDLLKGEWGFDGIVMSDWYGTQSTAAAANAGLDLEMPGPPVWRDQKLLQAVTEGEVDREAIDESVRRLLRAVHRAGAFAEPDPRPEMAINLEKHRSLARRAAGEAIVLLKNQGHVLPLDASSLAKVAVIGPNAKTARIMGGGSPRVNPHYAITPFDGAVSKLGPRVQVRYEVGCTNHERMPLLNPDLVTPEGTESGRGFSLTFYNSPDLSGDVAFRTIAESSEQMWLGEFAPGVDPTGFSARLSATFVPREDGIHHFGLTSAGLSRLALDGDQIIDNWSDQKPGQSFIGTGSTEVTAAVSMEAGRSYALSVEYSQQTAGPLAGVRLGHMLPVPTDSIEHAVVAASDADVALLFVGLSDEWESEGYDRPHINLVGAQDELVRRVAAANPRTVVVLQTGSPVAMPWLDQVAAVLQAWFPGQECGNGIADVLFGDVNPSGKLPQTFPARLEDNPAFLNYPGEYGKVRYGEGIFVGYRYYDKKKIAPLFPFGFGLSYTRFDFDNLRLSASQISPGDSLVVSIDVSNVGKRPGQEVVQLYLRDTSASVNRPEKELKAWAKVALQPGESSRVELILDEKSLAFWDESRQAWLAEAGQFEVLVGSSSADIRAHAAFVLKETHYFGGLGRPPKRFSLEDTIGILRQNAAAWAVVEKHLPGISDAPQLEMALGFTLVQVAGFVPELITQETLDLIASDLKRI